MWVRTDHPGRFEPGQRSPRAPPSAANAAEQRATRRLGSRCLFGMATTESVLSRAGASAGPGADSVMTPARTPGRLPRGPSEIPRTCSRGPQEAPQAPPDVAQELTRAPPRGCSSQTPETRQGTPGDASRLPPRPGIHHRAPTGPSAIPQVATGRHQRYFRQFLNMFHILSEIHVVPSETLRHSL